MMKLAIEIILCYSALGLEITSVPTEEALSDNTSIHIKDNNIQRRPFNEIIANQYDVVKIHIKEKDDFIYAKIGEINIRSLVPGILHSTKSFNGKWHEFDTDSYVYVKRKTNTNRIFKVSVDKFGKKRNETFTGIINNMTSPTALKHEKSQITCLGVIKYHNSKHLVVEVHNPLSIYLELYKNDIDFFIENNLKTTPMQCICCAFPQTGEKYIIPPQQKTRILLKVSDDVLETSSKNIYMYGVLRSEGGWGEIFEFVMPVITTPLIAN